jgi:hypothetical protein
MRRQHKDKQKGFGRVFLGALTIVSHVAGIVGTIVVLLDALHHW